MQTKGQREKSPTDNPVWAVINEPKFVEKCREQDPGLLARLRELAKLPAKELGKHMRDALHGSSDQRVGKFWRALSDIMTEEANAAIAIAIFEQCELPET